ncbi:hypothetical protein A2482_01455 [Candidatus Falkowbacteria bacterium RIFOXYC2_FULL_48_21]|uniref:YibE/F family protein n=1 Tax=Candidatus Falkowbacteria bacterium RIFOXYC2_FULL_48_21 TaxID=1798005 RepID=A0A1F5T937_9BACT|nr:MAG: hypothetical protein A2482_01455 [Candidatus Falkowbacteria bacterium RIFOXYC2_FULL_48_21]
MKKIFFLTLIFLTLPTVAVFAQDVAIENQTFEAKVLKIVTERTIEREDGSTAVQQDLLLRGLDGSWQDKEVQAKGIGDIDVVKGVVAKVGDKVVVQASGDADGNVTFVVTDHVRRGWLYFLFLLFAVVAYIIGKRKGLKALASLIVTFFIIMWFIVPRILAGASPLGTSIFGALIILAAIIYITWGISRKSHIAFISIFFSLILTGVLSIIFTKLTHLTGLAQEEAMVLIGLSRQAIDFEGLLLAGIIIGTLGVLDDIVVSQVSAVEQLKMTDPNLNPKQLFTRAISVGIDHISSMTNTLFLAYAGAALPLLLLFSVKSEPFVTFAQVLNNELIATEIVRTLTGSIGLILAVPICTLLAVYFIKVNDKKV